MQIDCFTQKNVSTKISGVSMFKRSLWIIVVFLICARTAFGNAMNSEDSLWRVLDLHRKIIFLVDSESTNRVARERDTFIARNFYVKKRELLERMEEASLSDSDEGRKLVNELISFTQSKEAHAADALAFMDLADALLFQHQEKPYLTSGQIQFLKDFEKKIVIIQDTYRENLDEIAKRLQTRGLDLEPWEDYISFLNSLYDRERLYEEFNKSEAELAEPATRGAESKKDNEKLVWGFRVPDKTVVLTFDDGPHYRNTGKVLDILKEYQVNGYFFAVGKNIGSVVEGEVVPGKKAKILGRALREGHLIANHSFSHAILTKLDADGQKDELHKTNLLLESLSGTKNIDFRPPYGSKNKDLLRLSDELGMRAVMWNIDSMDWADPVPESIVDRVMGELEKSKKGILLFHDIHKQTVQALPMLLTQLRDQGYRVVTIEGDDFPSQGQELTRGAESSVKPVRAADSKLYGESWALVVGVNKYQYWPQLSYAVNDARGVSLLLKEQYGFKAENIFELFDENATREKIAELLTDTLADPSKVKPNDRVFIFYAGHGMTRLLPSGRNLGYIIPVDAELNKFSSNSLSMTHLRDFSDMIPAKHVYFVMDSCYSGIALTRGGGLGKDKKYLTEISNRRARQILTAGGADQEVADGGPQGHSIFTWNLLQGLKGEADLDNNFIITASELGAFIAPRVSQYSDQTPVFGNLVGSEGGEFIFELARPSSDEAILSEEEKLRNEVESLREEIAVLKQQLAMNENQSVAMNYQLEGDATVRGLDTVKSMSPAERREKSHDAHRKGLELYKEKKYGESLKLIRQAITYNPSNLAAINDYGYILFRDGQYEKALGWLEKTIEIDPERVYAYGNIAEVLVALDRAAEAVPYYEYYLELWPDSPKRQDVLDFLKEQKRK